MKTTKKKTKKRTVKIVYTHCDPSGMLWRFVGGRPVSKLADEVMHDVGWPLRK